MATGRANHVGGGGAAAAENTAPMNYHAHLQNRSSSRMVRGGAHSSTVSTQNAAAIRTAATHNTTNIGNPNNRQQSAAEHNNIGGAAAVPNETGVQPTPLFERLVTEEVQELKAYARIVENQNRRLSELERVHRDLQARLEVESKGRQHLEITLEAREREWAERLVNVESDRDHQKRLVKLEQSKNAELIKQVGRKDQDIHKMLKKKYDNEGMRSIRNARHTAESQRDNLKPPPGHPVSNSNASSRSPDLRQEASSHKGPHQIMAEMGSAEQVRIRNAESLLRDFMGLSR